jgi:hypothetical protein
MAASGDVLELPSLGVRVVFRRTTAESDGAELVFDLYGRPFGFLAVPHVHPEQDERIEVLAGGLRLGAGPRTRVLERGEAVRTPAGTPHRHVADRDQAATIRITLTPAGSTEAWLHAIAEMDRTGQIKRGWPTPPAAARLLTDFPGAPRPALLPVGVQLAAARLAQRAAARPGRPSAA